MPKKDIKLRSVDTHFWDDNYVIDLDPIEKLLSPLRQFTQTLAQVILTFLTQTF